jgi:O-antigen ligase
VKKTAAARKRRAPVVAEDITVTRLTRVAGWLLMALVLLPPIVLFPTAKEAFRLPKLLVSEWLALASLVPLAWLLGRSTPKWGELWKRGAVRSLVPFALVATAGIWTTAHPAQCREGLIDLWIGVACVGVWSLAVPAPRLERLLSALLWPAGVLAFFGILQYHGIWRPLLFANSFDPRLAVTSTAGNPGDLAAYLVLPCLVAQRLVAQRWGRPRSQGSSTGPLIALILCGYAILITQTLAAIAALILASVLLWAMAMPWRRAARVLGVGAAAALLLVLAVGPLRTRIGTRFAKAASGQWNNVLTGRLDGWRTALWMMERHPMAGVGQGAFAAEFVPAKQALLGQGVVFLEGPQQGVFGNAHNEVLEVGADLGIPGLLALAWALLVLALALVRMRRVPPPEVRKGQEVERGVSDFAFAVSIVVGLGVLSLAQFPFRVALTAFPALIALSWILRRGDELEAAGRESEHPEESEAAPSPSVRNAVAAALAVLCGLALVGQTIRLANRREASRLLHQAETISVAIEQGRVPQMMVSQNITLLHRAAELDPSDVGIPIALGTQYLLMPTPDPAEAIAILDQAERLEPRPAILVLRGRALLAAGKVEEAKRDFDAAVRLDANMERAIPGRL